VLFRSLAELRPDVKTCAERSVFISLLRFPKISLMLQVHTAHTLIFV
jgi:hypothetical protein